MSRLFNIQDFAKAVPNHQFGFRREHGTEQQLARVTQFILQAYEERKFCSAVFVDIAEAFDRVWHDGLLYKLIQILPLQLFNILQSYLSERTFTVSLSDGTKSKTGRVSAGVPQGSVLGPILYTIYSSDMPMPILTQRRVNLQPNQNRMLLSTYADDTVIMCASDVPASAVRENQSYLVHFSQWAKKWAININPSKTGHIIFTLRKLNDTDKRRSPLINGELAPCVNAQTYLGVTLDRKLTLEHHVKKLKIRVRARECKLMWLIGKRSRLAKECKALIIKQLIMPIWQYAIPIWGALTCDTHVNRLQSLQNKIIRNSVNASLYIRSSTLRDTYDLKSIDEVFQLASARFANSCSVHANPEARNLIIQPYEPQRLRRPRYLQQLQQHILPLQSLARAQIQGPQNSPVQNDNIQRDDRPEQRQQIIPFLPTLLRLEEEELDRQETERLAEETRRRQLLRSRSPPRRFCEMQINAYRRRYRNGQLTREAAVAIIQGQPAAIQRIIVPDYVIEGQERSTEATIPTPSMQRNPVQVIERREQIPQATIPTPATHTNHPPPRRFNQPPIGLRLTEEQINIYRRKYRNGEHTRDVAIALIWDQPPAIQRIVIPDYVRPGQEPPPPVETFSLTDSQPSQDADEQPAQSVTQQPIIVEQHEAITSQETLLNIGLEQTQRELIRILDDDEMAMRRSVPRNPISHSCTAGGRTSMSRRCTAADILLIGWSILTSLSDSNISAKPAGVSGSFVAETMYDSDEIADEAAMETSPDPFQNTIVENSMSPMNFRHLQVVRGGVKVVHTRNPAENHLTNLQLKLRQEQCKQNITPGPEKQQPTQSRTTTPKRPLQPSHNRVVRDSGNPATRRHYSIQRHQLKFHQNSRQVHQQRSATKKSTTTISASPKQAADNKVMRDGRNSERVRNPAEKHLASLQQQLREEQQQLQLQVGQQSISNSTLSQALEQNMAMFTRMEKE
ncbi:uncharacterized protein LOC117785087 [Drosophila innubila]|uniref:uncharacterized protein LOC117785087 n=1 Tax=Drosophila innubila TaxID=198719 RepID=UPI00148DEFFA|nr:uncharacterized protein LOC117785087 [Drosophila innubila]